jgi:transposase-like protein
MVHHLRIRVGAIEPKYRRRKPQIERHLDEWTINELAQQIGFPEPTLYNWTRKARYVATLSKLDSAVLNRNHRCLEDDSRHTGSMTSPATTVHRTDPPNTES